MTILRGRDQTSPFSASVDVVVIGSGAGGSIVARELARAGRTVMILEEGGYHRPEEYSKLTPSRAMRTLAREAGLGLAVGLGDTPIMNVMAGKCVGGSSVLTGGVCFRIPDDVLHDWSTRLGLDAMTPEALDPHFSEIESDLSVALVPASMRSRSTELFVEGADRLGVTMKSLRRNTSGCKGAARCNFGCPNGAKMSVDVSVLPEARELGTVIVSDALVERIEIAGGVARGVRGRFVDGETGDPKIPFEVRARVVVVACGSLHTPILLRKSGLGTKHVGRHVTLHPAFRVGALFDETVEGWDGAMQSVYSDHYASEGLTLIGIYTAPSVLAAAFPGVGREHRRRVRSMPNLAFFGAMIHDEGGGSVRRWLSREPLVTYRMSERDRRRVWRGIEILGDLAFAAGAREVMLPIFGAEAIKTPSELRAFVASPPSIKKVECMSFHPLGSAKMSATPDGGVVKPTGESWAVANLFVADGSVLPTSIGVNSQLPVMGLARRIAVGIAETFDAHARRAA
ncbi:MAG: GMC family oxidoreductase [Labilithrix sp.]|nr:GMC family oxidoreductase [Labilithrix sp.]